MNDRLTTAELADYLRCGIGTARRLAGGDIPGVFDGRQWTVARADVESYVERKSSSGKHRRAKGQRGRGKSLGAAPSRGAA
jgi:excisionase family DNA binding protein